MPINFDERDIKSCVLPLGRVIEGGYTTYNSSNKPNTPGGIYTVFVSIIEHYNYVFLTDYFME